MVGFCYSKRWSEDLVVRPLSFEDTAAGTSPKMLKVSPAEPLGFMDTSGSWLCWLCWISALVVITSELAPGRRFCGEQRQNNIQNSQSPFCVLFQQAQSLWTALCPDISNRSERGRLRQKLSVERTLRLCLRRPQTSEDGLKLSIPKAALELVPLLSSHGVSTPTLMLDFFCNSFCSLLFSPSLYV